MSTLDAFACKKIAGKTLPRGIIAYRMDRHTGQQGDMREIEGLDLGGCSCCDYFIIRNNSIVLIETTHLQCKIRDIGKECGDMGMAKGATNKHIKNELRREHALKIYCSLLMLCRLSSLCSRIKNDLEGKKYQVWIINKSGETDPIELASRLAGTLSKAVGTIDIMSTDDMKKSLA